MPQVTLPELPYAYNALEPFISEEIMTLHHKEHHQTYVNGYNTEVETFKKAMADPYAAGQQIALQSTIEFNCGGHINHSLFWKNLAPPGKTGLKPNGMLEPSTLASTIDRDFDSFKDFKDRFTEAALGIQGSGWAWLTLNISNQHLHIITTPNHDPVLPPHIPLFGIDMWEHAFYPQYKDMKPDYLSKIWNVINFCEAERRLNEGLSTEL